MNRRVVAAALLPHLLFLLVSSAVVVFLAEEYPSISPLDEGVHFDFVMKVPDVPDAGEQMGQDALRETSCRTYGDVFPDLVLPKCSRTAIYDPNAFPGEGYSTAGTTGPLYYYATAAVARPVAALTGKSAWLMSRLVGALWLTALMSTTYLLARELKAPVLAAVGATLLVGTSNDLISSSFAIGPDVASAALSALTLLAAVRYDGSRRRLLLLLTVTLLVGLTKLTAFTAVGAAAVFLVLLPLLRARRAAREETAAEARTDAEAEVVSSGPTFAQGLVAAVSMVAVFLAVSVAWSLRYAQTARLAQDEIPINQMMAADRIDWAAVNPTMWITFLSPNTGTWNPVFLDAPLNLRLEAIVVGVLVFGALAAALVWRRSAQHSALGIGVLLLAVFGPVMLLTLNFYANGIFTPVQNRYGWGLLAAYVALSAWAFRSSGPARALLVLAGVQLLFVFV